MANTIYPEFFTLLARKGIKGVGNILFRDLRLDSAKRLWENGWPRLHITAKGAKALYSETAPDERIPLVALCRTPDEVAAIKSIKGSNAALNRALADRLKELQADGPQ